MKKRSHHVAWLWLLALPAMPMPALADNALTFDLKLDIDQDGKTDRVVIMQEPGEPADLSIFLGEEQPDPARHPDVIRKGLTKDRVIDLQSKGKGSLAITSCFGCGANTSTQETLTIVYRQGRFLVGGYSRDWDWNQQTSNGVKTTVGGCDINYLTGKATVSKGVENSKPLKGGFKPVALADWSTDKRPKACDF